MKYMNSFSITIKIVNDEKEGVKLSVEPEPGLDKPTSVVANELALALTAAANLVILFDPDGIEKAFTELRETTINKLEFMKMLAAQKLLNDIMNNLSEDETPPAEGTEDKEVPDAFKAFLDKLDFGPKPGSQSIDKGGE